MKHLFFVLALVVAMLPIHADAAPKKSDLAVVIESLALGMGDEYDMALDYLRTRNDVFTAGASAMEAVVARYPADADVARRLLDFAALSGDRGCLFAAKLVSPKFPAWVAGVLKRYPDTLGCEAMHKAVGRIPVWAEAATVSREAELFLIDAFSAIGRAGNVEGAAAACRFLEDAPPNVRMAAADVISGVRPSIGQDCLVRAFDHEKINSDRTMSGYFLESIARFGGDGAWPHLVAALDTPGQFERACGLVTAAGDDGYGVLVKAVRSMAGTAPKVTDCLSSTPARSERHVLPLLKDKSKDIRYFALGYFARNHSDQALAIMRAGFIDNNPVNALGMPRADILHAMASYPVEQIEDMIELALTDNDDTIRDAAMFIIRERKALNFADAVRLVAETDPNRLSRSQALGILWYLGDFEAEQLLMRMAQYEESTIAAEAARVLGYIGSGESIPLLRKLATTARGEERGRKALESLALLGLTTDPMSAVYAGTPSPKAMKSDSTVSCGEFRASVVGANGPIVMALPGGPGMDSLWARPWMDALSRKAVVVYVEPTRTTGDESVVMTPQDFECIKASLPDRKTVLVSDGLGGTAAQWLAFQIPNRIDGLITISAPMPGDLDRMAAPLAAALPAPFSDMVDDLFANAAFFSPTAFDYYVLKAIAPGLAGGVKNARGAMKLKYASRRLASARAELSRGEVRFVPMEVNKPVMWILPLELMSAEDVAIYQSVVNERPEMFGIVGTDAECGTMPQISCEKQVIKYIRAFLKDI